jgi:hypothetical protein
VHHSVRPRRLLYQTTRCHTSAISASFVMFATRKWEQAGNTPHSACGPLLLNSYLAHVLILKMEAIYSFETLGQQADPALEPLSLGLDSQAHVPVSPHSQLLGVCTCPTLHHLHHLHHPATQLPSQWQSYRVLLKPLLDFKKTYDSVRREVSAPTGHLQVRYTITYF